MPRTASILDEASWRENFGGLLDFVAKEQNIEPKEIGERLDRLSASQRRGRSRGRSSDWWRYVNAGRIPSPNQIDPLAQALRVPRQVLSVCAGYVDDIFECAYAVAMARELCRWEFPIDPLKAVMAFLFALFPSDEEMHIGNRGSLFFWMHGYNVRSNLTRESGFLTGKDWNGIWLYPVRSKEHLIEHYETPNDPTVTWVWTGEPRTEPWTWYSMRALLQVDLASPLACRIFEQEGVKIPKNVTLYEAQQALHRKAFPLTMRMGQAEEIVHYWADQQNKELAAEVREHLHPWDERTITEDAARWTQGERIEPLDEPATDPEAPLRVNLFPGFSWEADGRPEHFWR